MPRRSAFKAAVKSVVKKMKKTTNRRFVSRFLSKNTVYPFERYVSVGPEWNNNNFQIANGANATLVPVNAASGMITFSIGGGAGALVPVYSSFGYQFSLVSLPNLTDFTTLFDSYRIKSVKVVITPYSTSVGTTFSGAPNASSDASCLLHYCIDNDGTGTGPTAAEAGIQDLQQRMGYKVKRLIADKPIKITLKPRYAQSAYVSGVSTGYTQGDPTNWIDLSYSTMPHYGIIGVVEGFTPNATTATIPLRIETKYTLEFKTPR